jgi:hypothetical protein
MSPPPPINRDDRLWMAIFNAIPAQYPGTTQNVPFSRRVAMADAAWLVALPGEAKSP